MFYLCSSPSTSYSELAGNYSIQKHITKLTSHTQFAGHLTLSSGFRVGGGVILADSSNSAFNMASWL